MNASSQSLSLGWISADLDEHIDAAKRSFEAFLANPGDASAKDHLAETAARVKQSIDVFRSVELDSVIAYVEALSDLVDALATDTVPSVQDAYQVIIGAINQLENYLATVRKTGREEQAVLLAVISDICSAAGKSLPLANDLYAASSVADACCTSALAEQLAATNVELLATAVNAIGEGLKRIAENPEEQRQSLAQMKQGIDPLVQVISNDPVSWLTASVISCDAIIDSSIKHGSRLSVAARYVMQRAATHISHLTENSADIAAESEQDLEQGLNELLFCVAVGTNDGPSSQWLFSQFQLDQAIKLEQGSQLLRLGTPDVETLDIVIGGLIDDIAALQNALQCCADDDGDMTDRGDLSSMAEKIRHTLQFVQLFELSVALEPAVDQLQMAQREGSASNTILQQAAEALFSVEIALKRYRSGSGLDESELTVINQLRAILESIREQVAGCVKPRTRTERTLKKKLNESLAPVPEQLKEIRAVAGFTQCEKLRHSLNLVAEFFEERVNTQLAADELEAVKASCAQLVKALKLLDQYAEALTQSRHSLIDNLVIAVSHELTLADNGQNVVSLTADAQASDLSTDEPVEAVSVDSEISAPTEDTEVTDTVSIGTTEQAAGYEEIALEGDFDEEIVEIFLEEAEEVLATIEENYPTFKEAPSLEGALTEIRRAYHTLKGSGRMAGAEHLGEAAWSIENMLNRIIDKSLPLEAHRIDFLGEANQYMPILVDYFKRRLVPYDAALSSFTARAETLTADPEAEVVIGESITLEQNKDSIETASLAPDVTEIESQPQEATGEVVVSEATAIEPEAAEPETIEAEEIVEPEAVAADAADDVADIVDIETAETGAIENPADEVADIAEVVDEAGEPSEEEQLLEIFLEEAQIQLSILQPFFAGSADNAVLPDESVERAFHTLAGGARIAGVQSIADVMAPAEVLTGQIRRHAHIEPDQHLLLQQSCNWLVEFIAADCQGDVPHSLVDELGLQVQSGFTDEDAVNEKDIAELQNSCSYIFDAQEFLTEWRLAGSAGDQYQSMLAELSKVSQLSDGVPTLHNLSELMVDAYQILKKNGLHLDAHNTMLQSHAELESMLDRLAAGQSPEPSPATASLAALVETERSVLADTENAGSTSVAESTDAQEGLDQEIVDIFLEESRDLIEEVETAVSGWLDNQADSSYLETLLRPLHTIKGGARMAGLDNIGTLCHEFEALLQSAKNGNEKTNEAFFKKIKHHLDELTNTFSDFEANMHASDDESAEQATAKEEARVAEVIRVPADLLEQLVNLAGETSISRSLVEEQINEFNHSIDEIGATVERLKEQLRRLEIETEAQINFRREQVEIEGLEEFDPLEMDRYSQFQQLSKSLVESASDLKDLKGTLRDKTRDVETLLMQQGRVNTELQEGLMRTRTVPLSRTIVPRLRRTIRQVSGELDKPVTFDVGTADGELDRSVIERMVAPLEHVLRNAIDHGIEDIKTRVKSGKSETGAIRLDIHREGGDVVLKISDDGQGINTEAVRKKAIDLGLIDKKAKLSKDELHKLIFSAGFSTAKKVTQISGRGVGMDVVMSEIRELGGSIELTSEESKGTTFTFRLPFTVSMNRALLVSAGGESLAVPLDSIEGIVRVSPYELDEYYGENAVDFMYAGQNYDFRYLGTVVNGSSPQYSTDMVGALPVLLVRSGDNLVAFQVDRLLGSREIVVKSLGPQFAELPGIAGATVLGDGGVVMIADLASMVKLGVGLDKQVTDVEEQVETRDCPLAMVVDDSVTVRKVTTRLLERQGFEVITAKDGLDAMEKLEDIKPDFMLLDIEMPRLDGFEVVSRVRHDERLEDIPIIMITSRTGDKHRDRALALGANEFLGKPYQDQVLLTKIAELIPQSPVLQAVNE